MKKSLHFLFLTILVLASCLAVWAQDDDDDVRVFEVRLPDTVKKKKKKKRENIFVKGLTENDFAIFE